MGKKRNVMAFFLILILILTLSVPVMALERTGEETAKSISLIEKPSDSGSESDIHVEPIDSSPMKALSSMVSASADPIYISLQPQDQSGKAGDYIDFSIVAFGSNLTYAWYMFLPQTPGDVHFLTNDQYWSIQLSESYDGICIYCVVKDDQGNEVKSDIVTVTVLEGEEGIVIVRQPKDQKGRIGEIVLFDIAAKGDDLTYTWYMYHPQMPELAEEISSEQYWAVEIDEEFDGLCFYCVVSDGKGRTRKSDVVTLTVDKAYVLLSGFTTSLNGTIELNLYMEIGSDIVADKTAYMQFNLPGSNHTAEKVMLKDARKSTRGNTVYYVFSAGVAAKNMTSAITAQFFYQNGSKTTKEYSYTIKDYCDYIIAHPSSYGAKSVALAKAILNYGGYAQLYYNEKTDDLANKDIDSSLPSFTLGSSYKPVTSGSATGVKWLGSTVMTTTSTGIRHYFTLDGSASNYLFTVNGENLSVSSSSSGKYVEITGIKAKDLGTAKVLTVKNKKDNTTFTLKYSVYSNIKAVIESSSYNTKTRNLMKSLYYYCEAVKTYLGA